MRLNATARFSNSSPVWISARRVGVAAADFVAHVAQVGKRFDDDVAHDEVDGDHREEDGDDGGGHQDGAVVGLSFLRVVIGQDDFHHGDQVAGFEVGLARQATGGKRRTIPCPNGLEVVDTLPCTRRSPGSRIGLAAG